MTSIAETVQRLERRVRALELSARGKYWTEDEWKEYVEGKPLSFKDAFTAQQTAFLQSVAEQNEQRLWSKPDTACGPGPATGAAAAEPSIIESPGRKIAERMVNLSEWSNQWGLFDHDGNPPKNGWAYAVLANTADAVRLKDRITAAIDAALAEQDRRPMPNEYWQECIKQSVNIRDREWCAALGLNSPWKPEAAAEVVRARVERAVKDEREECAKVAKANGCAGRVCRTVIADAIRNRGKA